MTNDCGKARKAEPQTPLEQAIYATVYGTRMEAFLRSGTWIGLVHRGDEEQCEQVLADHVATAKADAKRAVELHRGE